MFFFSEKPVRLDRGNLTRSTRASLPAPIMSAFVVQKFPHKSNVIYSPALNLDLFSDRLMEAVSAAQVGFHFEEGGCWGMAAALYQVLVSAGGAPAILYSKDDFVHAWVSIAGRHFDYRGLMNMPTGNICQVDTLEELCRLADTFGVNESTFYEDVALAADIVSDAASALHFSIQAL